MICRICQLIVLALLSVQVVSGEEQESGVSTNYFEIRDFVLSDQFKKQQPQLFPKEKVSIFVLADRKGSDQLEDWVTPFYKRYEARVDICGVANMKGLPKVLRPMLRGIFKMEINHPVMMDWTGNVCEALAYRQGVADIVVADREGRVVHRVSGEATQEKLQACYAAIDRLTAEAGASVAAAEEHGRPPAQGPQASESTRGAPEQES
jgi:hypothetical protein